MTEENVYKLPKKADLKKIEISEFKAPLPELKNIDDSKSIVIANWLADRIKTALKSGAFKISDVLPSKAEFAYLLGVSIGTMQHAIRHLEDLGCVESKQCIGTMIKDSTKPAALRKLTSKRDLAVDAIKRYIINDGFKVGSYLPSSRTIATITGFSNNTTRLAIDALVAEKILKRRFKNARDNGWMVLTLDIETSETHKGKNTKTLVDMAVTDLEKFISTELNVGDRLPSHQALSKQLKVSLKTTHDALQVLVKKGYILARRGTYGTTVVKLPDGTKNPANRQNKHKPEDEIFAPAKDAELYYYEKTQNIIKKLIANDYEVGDKLPSIVSLAKKLDLSPNTIRTALHNLAKDGFLVFSRGRYGGTFVIDIPEITEGQTFKWLAVNPSFAKEYQDNTMN